LFEALTIESVVAWGFPVSTAMAEDGCSRITLNKITVCGSTTVNESSSDDCVAIAFNLDQYVTEKSIDGLFVMLAKEEANIRKNPAGRVTDLLENDFGNH
jgi:hypothetical protein